MLWEIFGALVTVAFFAAGVGLLFDAVRRYRRNRFIHDLPTSRVRSAARGLVELKGRAVPVDETLTSPFDDRDCLLCQYAIRRPPPKRSKTGSPPTPLDFGLVGVPFFLEDDTGRMLVRPEGAEIRLPESLLEMDGHLQTRRDLEDLDRGMEGPTYRQVEASAPVVERFDSVRRELVREHELPNQMGAFDAHPLSRSGDSRHDDLPRDGELRYAEARVEPGDEIYVLGNVQPLREDTDGELELFVGRVGGDSEEDGQVPGWIADGMSLPELPEMAAEHSSIFVISDATERELADVVKKGVWKQALGGLLVLFFAMLGLWWTVAQLAGG